MRWMLSVILTIFATAVFAVDTATTTVPEVPAKQYRVEVIVFKNQGPDSSGGELWSKGLDLPQVTDPAPAQPLTATDQLSESVTFVELQHLREALAVLRKDSRFDVTVARAWLQPLTGKNSAVRVPVGLPGPLTGNVGATAYTPPNTIGGTLKLYEHRLLFVNVDLTGRFPTAMASDPATLANPTPIDYHISETRRVKLNEVHYFDHPYLGAVVRVSRESGET